MKFEYQVFNEEVIEISFTKLDELFVNELFENKFYYHLFHISIFSNKIPSIFIGKRELTTKKKDKKGKPPKIIDYIGIDIHFILSVLYFMINFKDRELFYTTFYKFNDVLDTKNLSLLCILLNRKRDFFQITNNSFMTESIYLYDNKYYQTDQLFFVKEVIEVIKKDIFLEKFYNKLKNNSTQVAFYKYVDNYKKSSYLITREDWFEDSNVSILNEWNKYKE